MAKRSILLAGTAAALLGLGACGQKAGQTADTNAANLNAADANAAGELAAMNEPAVQDPGTTAANGSTAAPVAVVAPPPPAQGTPVAEAAPLTEAATITQAIATGGSAIERIPYQGGWAWRQNGHIVRTASADGRRVSYFRSGQTAPFLVQQDKQAVALANGKVQRAYTPQGRAQAPDRSTQQKGEQLAQQATRDHGRATDVAKTQPAKVQKEAPARPGDRTQTGTSKPAGTTKPAGPSTNDRRNTDSRTRAAPHNAADSSADTNQAERTRQR